MYSTAIHFRAYHHAFSLTRKRVPVCAISCLPSHFQSNTEMYSTAIHFRAYRQAFSSTRKHVPVVRNFVPTITLPVQHGNVWHCYTFSCLSSGFQFNTETCTSGAQFRGYHHTSSPTRKCIALLYIFLLAVSSKGLMSVVRSLLKLYAILVIPALPRLAQILPSVKQW